MYAKFRVDTSPTYGEGIGGVVNAIRALAVASAGDVVAKPAGVTMWNHIGNEEAGGHTLGNFSISTTNHNGYTIIQGPTDKNGYTRQFRFGVKNTNAAYSNSFAADVDFIRNGVSSYNTWLSYAAGANATNNYSYWKNYGMTFGMCDWHVSITADYVYIWYTIPGSTAYQMNYAGFANLNFVPDALLSEGNSFFPAVALYSGCTNANYLYGVTSSAAYYDFYAHSQLIGDGGNNNGNSYINQSNMYYTKTITNTVYTFNSQPLNLGSGYYASDPVSYNNTSSHTNTFDSNGNKVGSLNPYVYFNPFAGLPYTTVKGIAQYETARRSSTSYQIAPNFWTSQNELIYDANGTRWVQQHQPNQFGIRAFRAV